MSRREPVIRVRHMLDYSQEAVAMAEGRSRADLDSDRMLNLALVHLMEIIGEAASRIPDEFRRLHPNVPWREISDLRNRLIHGYDNINFDILWKIINDDLPVVIERLNEIIDQANGGMRESD